MPHGKLYINGQDAFDTWGVSLSDQGMSALLTPAPVKPMINNKSRREHGSRYAGEMKFDERTITIPFHLIAKTKDEFFEKLNAFTSVLASGEIELWTQYNRSVVYRVYFQSCTQFTEYDLDMAKFNLKLIEPDPTNRSLENRKYKFFILDEDKLDEGVL